MLIPEWCFCCVRENGVNVNILILYRFNPFNSEIFQFFALIYNKLGGTYVTLPSQVLIQYLKFIHMHGCVYI